MLIILQIMDVLNTGGTVNAWTKPPVQLKLITFTCSLIQQLSTVCRALGNISRGKVLKPVPWFFQDSSRCSSRGPGTQPIHDQPRPSEQRLADGIAQAQAPNAASVSAPLAQVVRFSNLRSLMILRT